MCLFCYDSLLMPIQHASIQAQLAQLAQRVVRLDAEYESRVFHFSKFWVYSMWENFMGPRGLKVPPLLLIPPCSELRNERRKSGSLKNLSRAFNRWRRYRSITTKQTLWNARCNSFHHAIVNCIIKDYKLHDGLRWVHFSRIKDEINYSKHNLMPLC